MRVIGGEFRSRRIKSMPGMEMRPTPDRMRETLFNILAAEVAGSTFLDAYAGTGAVGIEALSRGATSAVFLEKHKRAVALIRENLESLGLLGRAVIIAGPALRDLGKHQADIVFLDPPYPLEKEYAPALELIGRMGPRLAIAQHSVRFDPGERCGALLRYRVVRQGDNALSLYRKTLGRE
jgi:16S rRNA (guanine(966)-N(2))-methyltransferase RsmD